MAHRAELRPLSPGVAVREGVGLGCAPIGNLFTPVTDADAVATVERALSRGVRLFDTAPLYGSGESERKLGLALPGVPRDDVVIATKVGRLLVDAEGRPVTGAASGHDSVADLSRDGVWRSLEGSLARLGVDRIDVLHLHDPLDVDAAVAGALPALAELREQGVVRAISVGLGRLDPLERYAAEAPLDVLMEAGRLTLLDRTAQERLLPIAASRGIGVIAAGVFNSGILVDPVASPYYEYKPAPAEVRARALRLRDLCRAHGVRLADAAVQFPLRAGADAVVVGARTPEEVDAFVDGLDAAVPEPLWAELDAAAA
ncbi:aldo/keto reductase [Microbacterium hydrocarbonoxydans]|uniref:aldo/keto reductase n=1 Tax=Microbacterium hydrocarbonoxydans TaxID=273678 RepID=UPI0007BB6FCF|nr:aldo/keto reductase [Microbacterium hydrocarbonoxydans]GAT71548.1 oxidoreductase [Microbacterium sp. HM58-2]